MIDKNKMNLQKNSLYTKCIKMIRIRIQESSAKTNMIRLTAISFAGQHQVVSK